MVDASLDRILQAIAEIGPGLHTAGTFSPKVLDAIARAAAGRKIRHSVETGSGASTLLFSHLSDHHTVFAMDDGSGSVENVRRSSLLRADSVTFVEGPTQVTVPQHHFGNPLQLVLLDGPHAYPFPDLEYYYLYPHLEAGALLIVDDIHIRSVHNLFEFVREDAMFQLDQVVETTAFFTRTDAPVFDPFRDGWWLQGYNAKPLLRYGWKGKAARLLPENARRRASALKSTGSGDCSVTIETPAAHSAVAGASTVEGTAALRPGSHIWILVRRADVDGWWPQGGGPVVLDGDRWSVNVTYGSDQDAGRDFEIAAVIVGEVTHELWTDWTARVRETGGHPPVRLPGNRFLLASAVQKVRRAT